MDSTKRLEGISRSELEHVKRRLQKEQSALQFKRFFHSRLAVIGAVLILIMTLTAIFAPLLAPADPLAQTVAHRLSPPGGDYLLGTDKLGRDLLSRIIYGARVSMIVGVSVGLSSMVFGMILGLYACYYKALDNVLMRICDGLSGRERADLHRSAAQPGCERHAHHLASYRAEHPLGRRGAGVV